MGARDNCTCEYCCSVRDAEDDRQMAEEYEVGLSLGKDVFDELKVGDTVEYYQIAHEDRKVVFGPIDTLGWDYVKDKARLTFNGIIVSKSEYLEIKMSDGRMHKARPSACWWWGMHKI